VVAVVLVNEGVEILLRNALAEAIVKGGWRAQHEDNDDDADPLSSTEATHLLGLLVMVEGNALPANGLGSRGFAKLAMDSQNVDVATISLMPSPNFEGDRGCDDAVALFAPLPKAVPRGANGWVWARKQYSKVAAGALNARGRPLKLSPSNIRMNCARIKR
jgi:hypothetical protein